MSEKDLACGCPGSNSKTISRDNSNVASQLSQWPVQLKLVLEDAPYFKGADILISADCCAYSYLNFHNDFIKDKICIIACPKLDDTDYTNKLSTIFKQNDINSITVARMEVPCCYGIYEFTKNAITNSGKDIPLQSVVISTDGKILENTSTKMEPISINTKDTRTFLMKNDKIKIISFNFLKGEGLPNHTHDGDACVQVISGSATLTFTGGDVITLNPGDAFSFNAREEHNLIALSELNIIVTIVL